MLTRCCDSNFTKTNERFKNTVFYLERDNMSLEEYHARVPFKVNYTLRTILVECCLILVAVVLPVVCVSPHNDLNVYKVLFVLCTLSFSMYMAYLSNRMHKEAMRRYRYFVAKWMTSASNVPFIETLSDASYNLRSTHLPVDYLIAVPAFVVLVAVLLLSYPFATCSILFGSITVCVYAHRSFKRQRKYESEYAVTKAAELCYRITSRHRYKYQDSDGRTRVFYTLSRH